MSTAPANSSSTPILDRLLPAPPSLQSRQKKFSLGGFLIGCLIGLAGAAFVIWSPQPHQPFYGPMRWIHAFIGKAIESTFSGEAPGLLLLWRVATPLLALFSVVAVHEFGHAVLGTLAGFRLLSMRLGPLVVTPPFHVRWRRKNRLPGAAGFTVLIPIHSRGLRGRAVAMLLGGSVANLATGFAGAFVGPDLGWFSGWFVGFSIFMGLANLAPFRRLALVSDGKRILTLLFNSRQGERWLAILQLVTDVRNGVDPENLRPEFLSLAIAVQDDSQDTVSAHAMAYSTAYYKHDDAEAARLLEICLQYSGYAAPVLREAVFANAVDFHAKRSRRVDLAQQWLGDLPEKTIFPELRLNSEAAILEGQGDLEGALKKLEEAEKIILTQAEPDRRELSLKFLRRSRSELLQQRSTANIG